MDSEEETIWNGMQEILALVPPGLKDDDVIPADVQEKMKAITQRLISLFRN